MIAYIAGPYRAPTTYGVASNIFRAADVAKKYWKSGYTVICPHKNSGFFDGVIEDREWLSRYLELLKLAQVVVMIPGWEKSEGARAEEKLAKELGKTVIYEETGIKV